MRYIWYGIWQNLESFTGEDNSYRIYPNLFFFEVIESFFFPLLLRKWTQKKTKKVNQQAWATVFFGKKVTSVLTKTHNKATFFGFVFLSSNLQKKHVFMPNSFKSINSVLSNLKNNNCFCLTKANTSKDKLIFQIWPKFCHKKKTQIILLQNQTLF